MGNLIDDLLSFSRLSRAAMSWRTIETRVLVHAVLDEMSGAKEGRQVELRLDDLPSCEGDPALLKQVWVNLLSNAFKYTQKRKNTVIEIGSTTEEGMPVYYVRDNGTTFSACFPAADGHDDAPADTPDDKHSRGNGELILIVDDETSVRTITQQPLERFGYRVITAADGMEAVALYSMHRGEVAAVVTDMMMPVMGGQVTIQVLKRLDPDVRIIAASGLSSESSSTRAESLGVTHFLLKPFTAQAILAVLKEVIRGRS